MRVAGLVGAFEEVSSPDLPAHVSDCSHVRLHHREGNLKLDAPLDREL
jgi:hypothetical protein